MPSPKLDALLSLAIRRREAGCCVYCGRAIDPRVEVLTVDHLLPRVWWPAGKEAALNQPSNLAASCGLCNGLKGAMDVPAFAAMLDTYGALLSGPYAYLAGVRGDDVKARVDAAIATPLDWAGARVALALLNAQRGR
mgnify:CR=1 FL=1